VSVRTPDRAVKDAALATLTFVAETPPMVTVAPATKFVPLIVIVVPPVVGPVTGLMLEIVGGSGEGPGPPVPPPVPPPPFESEQPHPVAAHAITAASKILFTVVLLHS
jgi:hypothetical protein